MDPGLDDGQSRVCFDGRLVERKQPAFQALPLLPVDEGVPVLGHHVRGGLRFAGSQGVMQRFVDQLVPGKPGAGPAV